MPRSVEESFPTDSGRGLRRQVTLSRTIHISSRDVETRPAHVRVVLERAFRRKFLFDWYSRNHKRYSIAELWIVADVVKDDVSIESYYWSKTHSAKETAAPLFRAAVGEITDKIVARHYRDWYIHVLGVSMWRSGRG